MIAAFLVLRLRSVLGRRQGFERPTELRPRPDGASSPEQAGMAARSPDGKVIDLVPEPVHRRSLPDAGSPAGRRRWTG